MNGGRRWIRTIEELTTDLQSAPFGHFGILPGKALVKPIVVREVIITRKESNGASTQNRTENRRLKP